MNIGIIGCGRWGTALAWYIDKELKYNVTLYGRDSERTKNLIKTRKNNYLIKPLSERIKISLNIQDSLKNNYVIISIPSQNLREILKSLSNNKNFKTTYYILCMKGLERATGFRLSEILLEFGIPKDNIAVWVGPGNIEKLQQGIPTKMIVDSYNENLTQEIQETFTSKLISLESGNDIIGTEIGAATKNIIGIAAGILVGAGEEFRISNLEQESIKEVGSLIKALGGKAKTAKGLAHAGDYVATVEFPEGHNRKLGESLATNGKINPNILSEGYQTSIAIQKLLKVRGIDGKQFPIIYAVSKIIRDKMKEEA